MKYGDAAETVIPNPKKTVEFYKTLLENAFDGVAIVDENGVIKYQSPTVEKITGYSAAERQGKSAFEFLHPNDVEKIKAFKKELLINPGVRMKSEARVKSKNGSWVVMESSAINLLDNPVIKGIMINYRDITEKRLAYNQLQESEKKFRNMTSLLPVGIFETDEKGKSIYVNKKWCEISGLSPEESDGDGWLKGIHPEDRERIWKGWNHAVKNLDISEAKYRYLTRKGKTTWVFGQSVAYTDEQGNKKGFVGTTTDISELKKVNEALMYSRESLEKAQRLAKTGNWQWDIQSGEVYWSKECYRLLGLHSQKKKPDFNLFLRGVHADEMEVTKDLFVRALKSKKSFFKTDVRIILKEGQEKILHTESKIIRHFKNHKPVRVIGTIQDVTEQKKYEQALKESESRNKALVAGIPDMIFQVSAKGVYLGFKPANDFKALIPPEVFLGKRIVETLPPAIAQQAMKYLTKALKTKNVQSFVYSLPDDENETAVNYFEARIAASGKDEAIVLVREVTKSKEDEIALKKSEEKWRSLVENSPNFIATLDRELTITFLNVLDKTILRELLGKKAYETVDMAYQKPLRELMLRVLKSGIAEEIELTAPSKEGKRWLLGKYAPIIHQKEVSGLMVQAFDITSIKEYEENLQESNKKLNELNRRLESIREEEKKKIAIEIHDELGQELTAMKLSAFWLQQFLLENKLSEKDKNVMLKRVKTLIEISGNTINSVRKIAHELRPVILDSLGLIPAIEWQAGYLNEKTGVKFRFTSKIKDTTFDKEFAIAVFRIVQESLTNIIRHANAFKADISMFEKNKRLFLTIKDNGRGIRETDINQPGKIGLFGIKERIKNWKGEFLIKGEKDKGTEITVSFPLSGVRT